MNWQDLWNYFWNWTGFSGKKLWDFLQLAGVPLVLAIVAFRLQDLTKKRELEIADERVKQDILNRYFDQMSALFFEHNLRGDEGAEVRIVARARTISALRELDSRRNRQLINFAWELKLIGREQPLFDLSGADLNQANLVGANLEGVNLSGADLRGATLDGAVLAHANLTDANLEGAILTGVNFEGAILNNSNLSKAILVTVNLKNAHLSGVNLSSAKLVRVNLANADLSFANLSGAQFTGFVDLLSAYLDSSKWASIPDSIGETLICANLSGADLNHANLRGTNLNHGDLSRVKLRGADLRGALLVKANLTDADLSGSDLRSLIFYHHIPRREPGHSSHTERYPALRGANLTNANLSEVKINYKSSKIFTDVVLCNTTMPDGTIRGRDFNKRRND
jgi:uncharacterized protein YjbI with pentapeptide repeats